MEVFNTVMTRDLPLNLLIPMKNPMGTPKRTAKIVALNENFKDRRTMP